VILPDTELAWAAGFFDGEGWSSGNQQQAGKTKAFYLGISQKDPRPLRRFLEAVDQSDRPVYENRLNTVAWSGAKALAVLRKLWPYLSEPKREQAARALTDAHTARSRRYPKLNAIYDDAYAWLLELGYVSELEGR